MRAIRIAAVVAVLTLVGGLAGPASGAGAEPGRLGKIVDWPQFRFNDRHTGVNRFESIIGKKNVKFLSPTWQAQLGDIVDFSSPVVVNGVVYIGSSDGTLWAYPADGCGADLCDTPLWQSSYLAQILDTPTVANGFVYVGSQTNFNSNNGKLDVFSANGCGQAVCRPLWKGLVGPDAVLMSSPS